MDHVLLELTKVKGSDPLQYCLFTRDPTITTKGYMWHTEFRTESEMRAMLLQGGLQPEEVDQRLSAAPWA